MNPRGAELESHCLSYTHPPPNDHNTKLSTISEIAANQIAVKLVRTCFYKLN